MLQAIDQVLLSLSSSSSGTKKTGLTFVDGENGRREERRGLNITQA
jgi:hypothetical protein